MRAALIAVSYALLVFGATVTAEEAIVWPSLADVDSVSGRAATQADIDAGRAVFLLQSKDVSKGIPIDIAIPQYAYHVDSDKNVRTAVVVIQAEQLDDSRVVGALDVKTGQFIAALLWEFELFGSEPPE